MYSVALTRCSLLIARCFSAALASNAAKYYIYRMYHRSGYSVVAFTVLLFTAVFAFAESRGFDSELGIVYRPPSVAWDAQQWNAIFSDPNPPMGWAVLPVGKEGCGAVNGTWLNKVKKKGLKLAILFTPFLNPSDITRTIDCAVPLGFRRAVMDEYISYQTKNNGRPICTVISEVQSIYNTVKRKHPSFELGINDTWHTWMVELSQGQNTGCGGYPHFRYDLTGVSVLSKYGNPAQGTCDHPTSSEMEEQLIDLKPTVKDYSKTGRIFVWQLNQNWYPGGKKVLQLYRWMKPVHGWDRFMLFGPTTEHPTEENWAYNAAGGSENCNSAGFEWFLPAREYLHKIIQGQHASITIQTPGVISRNLDSTVRGRLLGSSGIPANNVVLQYIPPAGSPQTFQREITAPSNAILAFVGIRVNTQLPNPVRSAAQFSVQRVQLFPTGSTNNLVSNNEFNSGKSAWVISGSGSSNVITEGSENSLSIAANRDQTVSVTSLPMIVSSGRSYTVKFDARIFNQSRNGAYFYVSWNNPGEISRDRMFVTFPLRETLAGARTRADGTFQFNWRPTEAGIYTLFTFFRGTASYRPAIAQTAVLVQ